MPKDTNTTANSMVVTRKLFVAAPIEEAISKRRNPISAGSFIGVRKRTKDSAPNSPRESGMEVWMPRKSVVMAGPPRMNARCTPAPMYLDP